MSRHGRPRPAQRLPQLLQRRLEKTFPNPPALTIAKTPDIAGDAGGTIAAGAPAVFTIKVKNTGGLPATNVTVTDVLPTDGGIGWTLTSVQKNGADIAGCALSGANNANLNCAFVAPFAANDEVVIVLTSSATSLAFHCQGAQQDLSIDNGTPGADTTGDASADADLIDPVTDSGAITVTCPTPTLTIAKTPDLAGDAGGTIAAGAPAVFTIKVKNTPPPRRRASPSPTCCRPTAGSAGR